MAKKLTMGEAVEVNNDRYYGGRGEELAEKYNFIIYNRPVHDMFHLISGGALNVAIGANCVGDINRGLEYLERHGLASRLVGVKAEVLQGIYDISFELLNKGKEPTWELMSNIINIYCRDMFVYMLKYMDILRAKSPSSIPEYSHIPEINKLFLDYELLAPDKRTVNASNFFKRSEIDFHIGKAVELYNRLKESHPECVKDGKLDTEELLKLDVNELRIDNFQQLERLKLGDISRGLYPRLG